MTDRSVRLRSLADRLTTREDVQEAWPAKHFTDRLLVVEVPPTEALPEEVRQKIRAARLREANDVYDVDGAADADYAGQLDDGRRYRFVDVRERESLQSYVVD
jgi:hypothetical protein